MVNSRQKGFAPILILLLLLGGLVVGLYLVNQRTNLFPFAYMPSRPISCATDADCLPNYKCQIDPGVSGECIPMTPSPTPRPKPTTTPIPTPTPANTISVKPSVVTSGDDLIVSWNISNATTKDYIRILTSEGNQYFGLGPLGINPSNNCNLNNIPGITALPQGSCKFTSAAIGSALGIFRLGYFNQGGSLLTKSETFRVNAASSGVLTAIIVSSQVHLSWNGISNATTSDYINYIHVNDYSGAGVHTYWPTNNCSIFSGGTTPVPTGNCDIEFPFSGGDYRLVMSSDNGGILAISNNITIPPISFDGFKKAYGAKKGEANYDARYDANNDGKIDVFDLIQLRSQFK
ncbi:hypothetical protein HY404_02970 [Candidatus Microgenomates bacterium]|nr:hypothetical protein [Candidatus Microgenomates bacterium]